MRLVDAGSDISDRDKGRRQTLANKPASLEVPPDAVVVIETPGAGGYGSPTKRAAAQRGEDAVGGKFSARFMRKHDGAARSVPAKRRRASTAAKR